MKPLATFLLIISAMQLWAQSDTEVYLLNIVTENGKTELTNLRNISKNKGYDNQPSFYDDNTILFASTRHGQTDIASYNIETDSASWLTNTSVGSEYSPLRIPGSDAISAIRLDTTGLQRLYRYEVSSKKSKKIRENAKIGYHVWYSEDILVQTILIENRMDLVVSNFKDEINYTVQKNVGRSLHKVPNTNKISYISNEDGPALKYLDPSTGDTKLISSLPPGTNDICWLANGSLLFASDKAIYSYNPESEESPKIFHRFKEEEIHTISRMAISPDGKHLALVSEEPPTKIVQKQVDSYNAGDLDAFVNCYAENVVVRNFTSDTLYVGHEKMRKNYSSLSPENKVYDVVVVNRISIGNIVIDHEKVTGNSKTTMQIAIYEVNNGAISSMTFIFDTAAANPETIVQKQLDAYNARAIDGFLQTYTDAIEIYNFPDKKRSQGQEQMRKGYTRFFESTPDLHCEIKNRMVIGNKVIDEEYITSNGSNFSAVAIYEVENGKIAKVTFLK